MWLILWCFAAGELNIIIENEERAMSKKNKQRQVPLLLWPFYAIWRLLAWIVGLTGRLIAILLGIILMIVGLIISLTIVALPIGVPLIIFGLLLILRGLF
jgi:hypothetical protein